jgi:hypothetical protein
MGMRAISIVAVCCVMLLMASVAGAAQKFKPAPGCKPASQLAKLEASLKGEKQIPYDGESNPLARCNAVQPKPTAEMRSTGEPSVAIIVFDVTGSGRVVNQQAIGQKAQWTEAAQGALSQTLYEPLVEATWALPASASRSRSSWNSRGAGSPAEGCR